MMTYYRAWENRRFVRTLLREKQPELAAALESAIRGREAEIAVHGDALDLVESGRRAVVLIEGRFRVIDGRRGHPAGKRVSAMSAKWPMFPAHGDGMLITRGHQRLEERWQGPSSSGPGRASARRSRAGSRPPGCRWGSSRGRRRASMRRARPSSRPCPASRWPARPPTPDRTTS